MMSDEQLNGIQAFIAVAQSGSFTLAGERLCRSRSAIGKAVAKLESRLGVRLLQRTTRRVALTDEGAAFLQHSLRAFNALEQAVDVAHAQRGEVQGTIRLSVPVAFGRCWILPVIQRLVLRYPALRPEVSFTNQPIALDDERVDIAVRIGPPPNAPTLIARQIGVQHACLCAAPALLARCPYIDAPEALAHTPCLVSQPYQRWPLRDRDGETRHYAVRQAMVLDDVMALRDAALAGLGVARLPDWLAAPLIRRGALIALLTSAAPAGRPIHLLWPSDKYAPRRRRVTIDALTAHFSPTPPWLRDPPDDRGDA
ncbi:LysR family transcriptional regulator [Edwardsiella tarda]|uniref:LysR family transcriptional regulator n=1 Tax=Edwardsiella tarda TaxID=636 RepID=UPI00351C6440